MFSGFALLESKLGVAPACELAAMPAVSALVCTLPLAVPAGRETSLSTAFALDCERNVRPEGVVSTAFALEGVGVGERPTPPAALVALVCTSPTERD